MGRESWRELGSARKLGRAEEGRAIGRESELVGRGIEEREREISGKIERAISRGHVRGKERN